MASPGQPPKIMSSRLMGMKFMQRGAASPASSTASNSPTAKRAKLNSGAAKATASADQEAFQAVQAQEDAKREAVLDKLALEAGDTKWVLKAPSRARPSLRVVNAGYGDIDSSRALPLAADENSEEEQDEDEDEQQATRLVSGRKSYGRFNKHIEKQHNPDLSSSSEDESGDDMSEDESNGEEEASGAGAGGADQRPGKKRASSGVADELRAKKKAKRRADAREATELANRRRSREVKLNPRMTSISSGGGGGSRSGKGSTSSRPPAGGSCYICGRPDHKAAECPRKSVSGSSTRR